MTKSAPKPRKQGRWHVPQRPTELPSFANSHWPDISRWPTAADVETFRKSTKRNPDAKLAVLTGLRSFAETDMNPLWTWLGIWVSFVAVVLGATASVLWVQLLCVVVVAAFGFYLVGRMGTVGAEVELRKKRSVLWLRALEDETSR